MFGKPPRSNTLSGQNPSERLRLVPQEPGRPRLVSREGRQASGGTAFRAGRAERRVRDPRSGLCGPAPRFPPANPGASLESRGRTSFAETWFPPPLLRAKRKRAFQVVLVSLECDSILGPQPRLRLAFFGGFFRRGVRDDGAFFRSPARSLPGARWPPEFHCQPLRPIRALPDLAHTPVVFLPSLLPTASKEMARRSRGLLPSSSLRGSHQDVRQLPALWFSIPPAEIVPRRSSTIWRHQSSAPSFRTAWQARTPPWRRSFFHRDSRAVPEDPCLTARGGCAP